MQRNDVRQRQSNYSKLDGTHRVRTNAVLLLTLILTLTFYLSTQIDSTCTISQDILSLNTLGSFVFLSYAADISVNTSHNPNVDL